MVATGNLEPQAGEGASKEAPSSLSAIWGSAVGPGYVAVPNVLIRYFPALGVSPTEFMVLLNVMMHRWDVEGRPFPRVTTIARRLGCSPRTVQRAIIQLERLKLITTDSVHILDRRTKERKPRSVGTRRMRFDLNPLVARAQGLAQHHKSFQDISKKDVEQIAA